MKTNWFLIVNPTSGNGKSKKNWRKISDELKKQNIIFSFAFTEYSKHEEILVENAIKKGFTKIISVGGDGTLHHVVNGIIKQKLVETNSIQLAVIPIGTGNDWVKTYNIGTKIEKSIAIISKEKTILQDIGRLETENNIITYFTNVAGIGYDGYVASKLKKIGGIAYLLSGLYGLFFYKKTKLIIKINNQLLKEKCLMVVFGICKFSGGGMQFTKDVNTSDGLLDITIAKNLTIIDMILNLPKLYNGQIVHHKKVETYKTTSLKITPFLKSEKPFIQADGELINNGSISVSILKKAIQFIIP